MTIIDFNQKAQEAAARRTVAQPAASKPLSDIYEGPKPNHEDPHSRDFPPEPKDVAEGLDILTIDELLALRRFAHKHVLGINYGPTGMSLYKHLRFDKDQDPSVRALFKHKTTKLPYVDIGVTRNAGILHCECVFTDETPPINTTSLNALINILNQRLAPSPEPAPELEIWR